MYRGTYDFKKGYNPRTNIVEYQRVDLVADSHRILAGRMNYFSQLWNVHGDNDVLQTNIHTTEPLVPEPCALEFEIGIEEIKRNKLPGNDKTPGELFKAEGRNIHSEIRKLINYISNKEKMPEE